MRSDSPASGASPALSLEHVQKRFGATQALTDATLAVRHGTVHALLGENGAGKTTLMRVAYGLETPDRGSIQIHGKLIRLRSPADAIAHGVGMVHQHFTLVPAMTVAENLALGGHGRFDAGETATVIERLAGKTGLSLDPNERVRDLPVTAQQRLELLKVLSRDADILILDEPTAVLPPSQADHLLRQLRELADAGRAVVLITHKLREALAIADDVTVVRHGSTTLAKSRHDVSEEDLVNAMLGQRQTRPTAVPPNATRQAQVIVGRDVSVADTHGVLRVRNASFEVWGGEVVGIAAVEGSGHHELLRAMAGRIRISRGTLVLPEIVGFVPDDRQRDGLVLGMSLSENYALKGAGKRRGVIRWPESARAAREIMRDFDVRAPSEQVVAESLSGGNQQKFILGRELHDRPEALVIENPTRGLDMRASGYVRDRLLNACANGVAVVVHSSDLEEVVSIANRVLVVYAGVVRELPADLDLVGRAMLGAA